MGPNFALLCCSLAQAATVFPLALNWTDVTKTRMQTPPANGSLGQAYSGAFGVSARRILAEEGLLRLLARPALPRSWAYSQPPFPDSNAPLCMLHRLRELTLPRPTVAPTATSSAYF